MDGMRDVKIFPFFDSVKNPVSTVGTSNACFNAGFDTLVLEVSDATTISAKVLGCVNQVNGDGVSLDDDDCAYSYLSIMDVNYDFVDSITDNGIYYVAINGCSRIKVELTTITGAAHIVGAL